MRERSRLLRIVVSMLLGVTLLNGASACELFHDGDKVLLVTLADEDSGDKLSELGVVEKALEIGGSISVNVSTARQVEKDFDTLYAVSDTNGQFIVAPAILNWVGGNGWRLIGPSLGGWIFVKPRR